jgi:hypothetical protein
VKVGEGREKDENEGGTPDSGFREENEDVRVK